jgi:hypothetical protein
VKDYHIHVYSQKSYVEAIVREFQNRGVENLRILLARAEKARDVLPNQLSALDAQWTKGFRLSHGSRDAHVTGAPPMWRKEPDLIPSPAPRRWITSLLWDCHGQRDADRQHRSCYLEDHSRAWPEVDIESRADDPGL